MLLLAPEMAKLEPGPVLFPRFIDLKSETNHYSDMLISVQWRMFLDLKGSQMGQWTRLSRSIRPIWFRKHQVPLYPHGRSIHGCAGSTVPTNLMGHTPFPHKATF